MRGLHARFPKTQKWEGYIPSIGRKVCDVRNMVDKGLDIPFNMREMFVCQIEICGSSGMPFGQSAPTGAAVL